MVDIGLGRIRPAPRAAGCASGRPTTWRRAGRYPEPAATSTPAAWSASTPAPTPTRAPRSCCPLGAVLRRRGDGPLPRRRPAPAQVIGAELPNVVFAPGRVQACLFGSGWGDRADGDRGDAAGRSTPGCRPWSTPTGCATCRSGCPSTGCSPRTPASWPGCWAGSASWVTTDPVARGPGRRADRPVRPCCSRGRPSWWPRRDRDWVEVALPGPGLDRSGRVRRHARRHVCRLAGGRPVGARTAAVLAASLQAYDRRPASRVRSRRPDWPSWRPRSSAGCSDRRAELDRGGPRTA